jgi:hypothetical protein
MSFWTALKLSFTNIRTKKGRTFLTAFASSIGIISIGVVLALSGGFQKQIDETQSKTLAQYPITISQQATDMQAASAENPNKTKKLSKKGTQITAKVSAQEKATHINKIDQKYLNYVNDINPDLSNNIGYTRLVGMNLIRKVDGKVQPVTFSSAKSNSSNQSSAAAMAATTGVGTSSFPKQLDNSKENFLKKNYRLLSGAYPKAATDVVLVVKSDNTININALNNLGFDVKDGTKLDFNKIVGN